MGSTILLAIRSPDPTYTSDFRVGRLQIARHAKEFIIESNPQVAQDIKGLGREEKSTVVILAFIDKWVVIKFKEKYGDIRICTSS